MDKKVMDDFFGNEIIVKIEIDEAGVMELAKKLYGLEVILIKQLDSYDDKNFYLQVSEVRNPFIEEIWPHGYLLKILNSTDSKEPSLVEAQNCMMIHLGKDGFMVPQPVKNINGNLYSLEHVQKGDKISEAKFIVRLLTYQKGNTLKDVASTEQLIHNTGRYLAEIDISLKGFFHPAYEKKKSIWMLEHVIYISSLITLLEDEDKIKLSKCTISEFEDKVLPQMASLEKGIIHGDYNEFNVLVKDNKVVSLLDYGDSHYGPYLFEVAIALCYITLYSQDLESGKYFLDGYKEKRELTTKERELVKICVCARITQSLVLGNYCYMKDTGNEYILSSQKAGWKMLRLLSNTEDDDLYDIWGI